MNEKKFTRNKTRSNDLILLKAATFLVGRFIDQAHKLRDLLFDERENTTSATATEFSNLYHFAHG